jgi:hypothetical protein
MIMGTVLYWCTPLDDGNLSLGNLTSEQRKWNLKGYCKTENVTEVQKYWKNEFGTPPSTWVTVTKVRAKCELGLMWNTPQFNA